MDRTLQLADSQIDEAKLGELCRRYGVTELAVFGSAVRGEMGPDSDIDVLVEFDPSARIGVLKFESLSEELEALLGRKEVPSAALRHHLTVIGEAINRLSPELRSRHSEVPWKQIVAVRHRIVHAHFDLDLQILWNAAVDEIPQLRKQISGILDSEFPESGLPPPNSYSPS